MQIPDGYTLIDQGLIPNYLMHEWPGEQFPDREEIEAAKRFLVERTEPSKSRTYDSYALKHRVEELGYRHYCSNGALIAAAIELGLKIRSDGERYVDVYVKSKLRTRGRERYAAPFGPPLEAAR